MQRVRPVAPVPVLSSAGKKVQRHSDFSEEYVGREISVRLHDGSVVKGVLVEARRYWFKVKVSGKIVYLNKAHVVFVEVG